MFIKGVSEGKEEEECRTPKASECLQSARLGAATPPPPPPLFFRNADAVRCRVFFSLRSGKDVRERRWCWWWWWWCGVGGSKRGNPRRNQKQQICFFLPPRSKPAQGQRLLSPRTPCYLKEDVFTNRPLTVSRRANQGRVCASFFFLFFSSQAGDAHCPGASFIRGKHRHSAVGATRHAASC